MSLIFQYQPQEWRDILAFNKLDSFDALWALQLPAVDAGNGRRGGHSWVCRHHLAKPNGGIETIYIKRQEKYTCSSLKPPFFKQPTFAREFDNRNICNAIDVPSFEVVYFGKTDRAGGYRAILVTQALPGLPLDQMLAQSQEYTGKARYAIIKKIALTIQNLHQNRFAHGHLLPKHVFVACNADDIQCYIIDLESMRSLPILGRLRGLSHHRFIYDLIDLNKHTLQQASKKDRLCFLKAYLNVTRVTPLLRKYWQQVGASRKKISLGWL